MINFGFKTEAREVVQEFAENVKGHTFLITGPSPNSLGAETAISLAAGSPATIILIGRQLAKVQPVIDAIKQASPPTDVKFFPTDLESLKSVRATARAILADPDIPAIHVVLNVAGVMFCPRALTEDGFERQLQANYLGHWLLTNSVMPKVLAAGAGARVVNVSSVGNKLDGIQWGDLDYGKQGYDPYRAYGQSKTAGILSAAALDRRVAARGVRAFAVNPGSVATNLQGYMTSDGADEVTRRMFGWTLAEARADGRLAVKTLQQGAATQLRAALDPSLQAAGGVFLNDCEFTTDEFWVAPHALGKEDAERLWSLTEEILGEKFDY